jgi:hypothetical protein
MTFDFCLYFSTVCVPPFKYTCADIYAYMCVYAYLSTLSIVSKCSAEREGVLHPGLRPC